MVSSLLTFRRSAAVLNGVLLSQSYAQTVVAQVMSGGDVTDGIPLAEEIDTGGEASFRAAVIDLLYTVLSYMGLAAVVVLCIIGIYLIVGLGSEDARDRARKVLLWIFIGFLVIALSTVIVAYLNNVVFL